MAKSGLLWTFSLLLLNLEATPFHIAFVGLTVIREVRSPHSFICSYTCGKWSLSTMSILCTTVEKWVATSRTFSHFNNTQCKLSVHQHFYFGFRVTLWTLRVVSKIGRLCYPWPSIMHPPTCGVEPCSHCVVQALWLTGPPCSFAITCP